MGSGMVLKFESPIIFGPGTGIDFPAPARPRPRPELSPTIAPNIPRMYLRDIYVLILTLLLLIHILILFQPLSLSLSLSLPHSLPLRRLTASSDLPSPPADLPPPPLSSADLPPPPLFSADLPPPLLLLITASSPVASRGPASSSVASRLPLSAMADLRRSLCHRRFRASPPDLFLSIIYLFLIFFSLMMLLPKPPLTQTY
ncbi:unnamed protein product [Camellia sinensis]